MQISEIKDGMRRVDVEGQISETAEPRNVNLKSGGEARVAEYVLKDDSGTVKLVLWDDQIDQVHKDDKVKVSNGYTSAFRGEVRLNVGKYGKIEVLPN